MQELQIDDIQGLIVKGFGDMPRFGFLALAIEDAVKVRSWLGDLELRSGATQSKELTCCTNIAFTATGIRKLGLDEEAMAMFSGEFSEGMSFTDHRRRILGDTGESAPENWRWGGPNTPAIDILLLCYGVNDSALENLLEKHKSNIFASGLSVLNCMESVNLPENKEHFGFRDGIAQPAIIGLNDAPGIPDHNRIAAGEFILGYPNAYGQYTDRPLLASAQDQENILPAAPDEPEKKDVGLNGSYLVFRQLSQDVRGFWQTLNDSTKHPGGISSPSDCVKLGAKMVGRWPSGAPLVKAPDADNPDLKTDNDFLYVGSDDMEGLKCPIGSHIRRSHPRDALDPEPGSERSIDVGKRHRILRRGRHYGEPLAKSLDPSDFLAADDTAAEIERGLFFICFNSHIGRQFEFVQHTWVNNTKFDGLYEDDDPLIGSRALVGGGKAGTFTVQAKPVRKQVTDMPRFVQVKGGGYFFMPGIRAIRYLASLSGNEDTSHEIL